jgi:DNA segregation ATPase FtsK/SpoIIIE-like protein
MGPIELLAERIAQKTIPPRRPTAKSAAATPTEPPRRKRRRRRRSRPWPLLKKESVSLWDPVPVMRAGRKTITMSLPYRSLIVGGAPGAGKSSSLSMLLAAAANDPEVELWLFDYKRVELASWKRCAKRFVGPDMAAATKALDDLLAELDKRSVTMESQGIRKVERGQFPLIFLVVDELMLFTTNPDKKAAGAFSESLRNAVALGRAYGLITVVCTQKPEGRVIDTNLRDLFAYQWALRCNTPQASNTILGDGRTALGYNAATIAPWEEGMGLLAAEDGLPILGQAYHLTDAHIAELVERAERARGVA